MMLQRIHLSDIEDTGGQPTVGVIKKKERDTSAGLWIRRRISLVFE